jgi:hypothetical protein
MTNRAAAVHRSNLERLAPDFRPTGLGCWIESPSILDTFSLHIRTVMRGTAEAMIDEPIGY